MHIRSLDDKHSQSSFNLNATREQMLELGGKEFEGGKFWIFKRPVSGTARCH